VYPSAPESGALLPPDLEADKPSDFVGNAGPLPHSLATPSCQSSTENDHSKQETVPPHPTVNILIVDDEPRNLLALEASRAREFYASAEELLPLINRDSRAALWVLVTIYRGLLERIVARNYDVFSERVSVPTARKSMILVQGMAMAVRNRMGL